jgi:beta-glucosidase
VSVASFDDARRAVAAGASPADAARALVSAMTPEERLWCLDGDSPTWAGLKYLNSGGYHKAPFVAGEIERIGLGGIRFGDGPRGAVVGNATCFPVSMARGATWDPALEERVGDAIGRELRVIGANLTGAVCINVLRHPAWGRAQETYGEDPHHVGEMGAALTRGLQRHVMACVKHFACNSMRTRGSRSTSRSTTVALHEVYSRTSTGRRRRCCVGEVGLQQRQRRVGRSEPRAPHGDPAWEWWGFEGFVISELVLFGLRDAAESLAAGLDVEMPSRMIRAQHPRVALERGGASWADVDRSVERVVATLLRFDGRPRVADFPAREVLGSVEHRALAREVAARSVVLLRNEPSTAARAHRSAPVPASPSSPSRSDDQPRRRRSRRRLGPRLPTVLDGFRAADRRRPRRRARTSRARSRPLTASTSAVVVRRLHLRRRRRVHRRD